MKLDVLTKLNNKKKMWISPKHPFYFESMEFKIMYSAGVFVHSQLNKTINTLNNFELQRLLTKGFSLDGKEIAKIIGLAKEGKRIVDQIISVLDLTIKKYMFILDLTNVSMRTSSLSEEELQSIAIFAELLKIPKEEKELLCDFIKFSYKLDTKKCIQIFEQMLDINMPITMSELKYYIPEIAYVTKIESKIIREGTRLQLVDNCEIREMVIVPSGTTLNIANAIISLYGTIVVDGGTLIIRDSVIENKANKNEALIVVKNFSKVEIYNSCIDCKNMGGAIDQENGNLTIINSNVYNTTNQNAIKFWGKELTIENTKFANCFSTKNGGALFIQNGSGFIKKCTFIDCEARSGGAIHTTDQIAIINCQFQFCKVIEYGAAIFYNGEVESNIVDCEFVDCYPKKEEVIQYIGGTQEKVISKEYSIRVSTILDKRIVVTNPGVLTIANVTIYMKQTIICKGNLNIKNSKIIALDFMGRDLFDLTRARACIAENCEFDGRLKTGIFHATGTNMLVENSLFQNTFGGRAIYDAFEPIISNCIFSYCLGGAINSCSGRISKSLFINCREKSGAGILMYGSRGEIEECKFIRCVSDYSGGAIDMSAGHNITNCTYVECKPNDVS